MASSVSEAGPSENPPVENADHTSSAPVETGKEAQTSSIGEKKRKGVEKAREKSRKAKPVVVNENQNQNAGSSSRASELTLSFQGKVYVFPEVSYEKVQAILMLLGGLQTPFGNYELPCKWTDEGMAEVQRNLNMSRRVASLIRFREKRKEREFDKKDRYKERKDAPQRVSGEDRECSLELNDTLHTKDNPPSAMDSNSVNKVPKIGMVFQSDVEAFKCYNQYARSVGFSVRKSSSTHRSDKTVSRRIFCCSKEGNYRNHTRGPPTKQRLPSRTDCRARFVIKIQGDGHYTLAEFIEEHNHELAPPSEVHVLRSHRRVQDIQGGASGYGNMNAEVAKSPNLNCSNCLQNMHDNILKKEDAEYLVEYFKCMQKESPYFFYSVQLGENNQVCNCFWSDSKSRVDYSFFGDVVCLDTRYRISGYDKPFTLFVGLNNHGQTILFGCGLLLDESTESFQWVLETFLAAMNGKQPKALFTDQATEIVNAVRQVLPNTVHRFSLNHIYQNSVKHLSNVLEDYNSFMKDFKSCINENDTEEEFQSIWHALLDKYNLQQNEWLQGLYEMRENWAQVYGRDCFCAGVTTTQRSETMEGLLKRYFKKFMSVHDFVTQYEKAMTNRHEKERDEDFNSRRTKPDLQTKWPVEVQAAERYTPKIFTLFQEEYVRTLDLFVDSADQDNSVYIYKVLSFEKNDKPRTVTFDSSNKTVKCSCKKFEMTGIFCAHALKVLHDKQLPDLPSEYFLNRWTKDAKAGLVIEYREKSSKFNIRSSFTLLFSDLAYIAIVIAVKGASTDNSCTFAKGLLIHVLEELDGFLNSDTDQTKVLDDVRSAIMSLRDLNKKAKSKMSGRPKGTLEKGKKNEKGPAKTKGANGLNGLGEATESGYRLSAASEMSNIDPARQWHMPQYAQEPINQVGQTVLPHSDTDNARYGVMSGGWSSQPSWQNEIAPENAIGCSGASSLQGLSFRPTRPLSMPQVPCSKGSAGPADQASNHGSAHIQPSQVLQRIINIGSAGPADQASNHGSAHIQPSQGFIGFSTQQASSQRLSEPPMQQQTTQGLEYLETPAYR